MPPLSHWIRQKRILGTLQVTVGALMISFSAVFVKVAHVGPTVAGFYRVLFGGIVLVLILRIRRERLFRGFRHLVMIVVCSLLFALDLTFWHRSIGYVGPGLATLLANFQVFFLALFGATVLRERLTWRGIVSIPLAMVGLYLIVGHNWPHLDKNYRIGVLFGLATAICYAAYILSLKKTQSGSGGSGTLATVALISLFTAVFMGAEAWTQNEGFRIPDLQSWIALIGYGIVGQVLGWVLISAGLAKIEASRVGLILLLQPTLAFVWDILFFARPTSLIEVLGALIVLLAIYLGTVR